MKPLADHVCLSPKCRTPDGEATVYELPVGATHCPMGHRRLQRLFNHVNVLTRPTSPELDPRLTSSSRGARLDAIVEEPMRDLERRQREARELAAKRYPMVRVVPTRGLPQALGEVYGQANGMPVSVNPAELTHKAQLGGRLNETMSEIQAQPMRPVIAARDTEHKIVHGPNGPRIEKA